MKPFTIINFPGTNVSKGWNGSWVSFSLCHSVFEGHDASREDCAQENSTVFILGLPVSLFMLEALNRSSLVTCIISQSRSPWKLVQRYVGLGSEPVRSSLRTPRWHLV